MMWLLINLVVAAVVLRFVAGITNSVDIENWGSAFGAAVIISMASFAAGYVITPLLPIPRPHSAGSRQLEFLVSYWQVFVLAFVANSVGLLLAAAMLPGIRIRRPGGFVLVLVLLTIADIAVTMLVGQLAVQLRT